TYTSSLLANRSLSVLPTGTGRPSSRGMTSVVVVPTSISSAGPGGAKRPATVANASQFADAAGNGLLRASARGTTPPAFVYTDTGTPPALASTASRTCWTP